MRIVAIALGLLACGARAAEPELNLEAPDLLARFDRWAKENKWTPSAGNTRQQALRNFAVNLQTARALEKEQEEMGTTAVFGDSIFAGMTPEEFADAKLMRHEQEIDESLQTYRVGGDDPLPESFDWREHGAVTSVKDQGYCGSCWAFSTAGALEGAHYIANEKELGLSAPTDLSVEQFAECDTYNYGCYGGYMDRAFKWAMEQGGVASDETYPYTRMTTKDPKTKTPPTLCLANQTFNETGYACAAEDDPPCTNFCNLSCELDLGKKHPIHARISSFERLVQDETEMMRYIATKGPLAIAMNATPLQLYKKGIASYKDFWCSPNRLNHALLIVGYGSEEVRVSKWSRKKKVVPYWIIKNSWGEKWGENGYFRLLRGQGTCGVHKYAVGVFVEKNENKKMQMAETIVM